MLVHAGAAGQDRRRAGPRVAHGVEHRVMAGAAAAVDGRLMGVGGRRHWSQVTSCINVESGKGHGSAASGQGLRTTTPSIVIDPDVPLKNQAPPPT
eukprot:356531-Chlamydomonas_euryale.AAC.5